MCKLSVGRRGWNTDLTSSFLYDMDPIIKNLFAIRGDKRVESSSPSLITSILI